MYLLLLKSHKTLNLPWNILHFSMKYIWLSKIIWFTAIGNWWPFSLAIICIFCHWRIDYDTFDLCWLQHNWLSQHLCFTNSFIMLHLVLEKCHAFSLVPPKCWYGIFPRYYCCFIILCLKNRKFRSCVNYTVALENLATPQTFPIESYRRQVVQNWLLWKQSASNYSKYDAIIRFVCAPLFPLYFTYFFNFWTHL